MDEISGKLFKKDNVVSVIKYDNTSDYYKFVKEYSDNGYFQVVLTSPIMISLLKTYFVRRKYSISKIELIEEDYELGSGINKKIIQVNFDREKFIELVDDLYFLNEHSSIDIKRIEVKKYGEVSSSITFQVNGVLSIDQEHYETESIEICKAVEELLV